MIDFFGRLFDTTDFPARWGCGRWTAGLGWLHIVSDLAVFAAYLTIPLVLTYFILKRKDIAFPRVFWLFGAFIAACGTGHLIEAGMFWWPAYRLSGLVKAFTAVISWTTVIALIRVVPEALRYPGLAEINRRLELEIEERKRGEQRLRIAIEAAPNGMVMVNREGRIAMVNTQIEQIFGYPRDELIGSSIETLVPKRVLARHPSKREAFFNAPRARAMGEGRELFGLRRDGTEFPVEIGLNPIETAEGAFVLAAIVDITERKRVTDQLRKYSEELERSNDELDRFAYVASHDLKAPLRAVENLARWINDDNEQLGQESRRHLELMQQRIHRMDCLLDDLLLYSRAGRVHGDIVEVDTGELVRETIGFLGPPEEFRFEIAPEMPVLTTARVPLEQCLRNLIGNAIKHHDRQDGVVQIDCRDSDDFIVFSVTDDGPGIPAEYHERIFEMFQTLRSRDEVEGSGMGLSVIRKTADYYGGSVSIASDRDRGTTFELVWPKEFPVGPEGGSTGTKREVAGTLS